MIWHRASHSRRNQAKSNYLQVLYGIHLGPTLLAMLLRVVVGDSPRTPSQDKGNADLKRLYVHSERRMRFGRRRVEIDVGHGCRPYALRAVE